VIFAADQVSQLEGCPPKLVGKLLRLVESTPRDTEPSVLLSMVASCARVRYPSQMLKAAEACFLKLHEFSHD